MLRAESNGRLEDDLGLFGCDAVELWVREHEKYFRCQTEHLADQPSFLDVSPVLQDGQGA